MADALYSMITPVLQQLRDRYNDKSLNFVGSSVEYPAEGFEWEDLRRYSIAILGAGRPQESGLLASVREQLYALYLHVEHLKIIDLGDFYADTTGQNEQLDEIIYKCLKYNTFTIVVGKSLTYINNCYHAVRAVDNAVSVTHISNTANIGRETEPLAENNYLAHLLNDRKDKLFGLNLIGFQLYQTDPASLALLNEYYCQTVRLGAMRNDIKSVEPVIRDSDMFSINMSSVRLSDAPSAISASPNGLYAEELCQLARYAGISDRLKLSGVFGFLQDNNNHNHTTQLVAQAIWHLIDGFVARKNDNPLKNVNGMKKYIVDMGTPMQQLVFYFSNLSERWWMEVPSGDAVKNLLVACSHDDYRAACNLEVPLRWIWFHQKITQKL